MFKVTGVGGLPIEDCRLPISERIQSEIGNWKSPILLLKLVQSPAVYRLGVGLGVISGDGLPVGLGTGVGLSIGLGTGVGVSIGLGTGDGFFTGLGVGSASGEGLSVGSGEGVALQDSRHPSYAFLHSARLAP